MELRVGDLVRIDPTAPVPIDPPYRLSHLRFRVRAPADENDQVRVQATTRAIPRAFLIDQRFLHRVADL